jgi:hypothetical protein
MAVQIQLRRGTAAAWTSANPTLAVGELVIETDTDKYKIGDGSTAWTSLGYSSLPTDAITTAGGVTITGTMTHGADGTGADVRFNSGTAGDYMLWDASEEQLVITGTNGAVALNVADGNATFADDVTITGNLTVNGATTTVSTTNTVVADSLFELNNGASSNANDCGIVIERGSTGDNAIIAWDESADKFTMGTTTATGASTGDLSITAGTVVANVEGAVTGNASTATALVTARTIGGTSFDGTANITPANATLAATATALANARTIGGVSFDGTANINLPGVNATGNQNTSGTAATVTGAAQSAITSVGTMTGLAVDGTSQLYECVTEAISGNKTPALTDAGKVFYCSQSGGTQTITIDGSISWPVGTQMVFVASNTSTVTFAESNSTSLDSKDDNKSIDGRYASAALINYGSNTWFLIGALA